MGNTKIILIGLLIAVAFGIGRWSSGRGDSGALPSSIISSGTPQPKEDRDPVAGEGSTSSGVSAALPRPATSASPTTASVGATSPMTKLDSKTAEACLTQVSRRDFLAHMTELDAKLDRFHEADLRFPSRTKMNASDWKRISESGTVVGAIQFKMPSAASSEIKVQFKDQYVDFKIQYRRSTAEDVVTNRSSVTLVNGRGTGVSQDGSAYHLVVPNPVQELEWTDYSSFALSVPFDWSGRSEASAEVFGLNEEMKWENVGHATLTRAR